MSEKHAYSAIPPSQDTNWDPSHQPADNMRMGHQAVPGQHSAQPPPGYDAQYPSQSYQEMPPQTQQYQGYAPQRPMSAGQPGGFGGPPSQILYISAQVCPVTGGAHVQTSRPGMIGLIIGIVFCPIGCIALCFDQKKTCVKCRAVIEEAWGGC